MKHQKQQQNAIKRQARHISDIINMSAFGKTGDPSTYTLPYDPRTGNVGEVKFDDPHAKNLEAVLPEILSRII
jgi:hypothetical protein